MTEKKYEESFVSEKEYREYIYGKLNELIHNFMREYNIGVGSEFFSNILRRIADAVDD